MNQHRRKQVLKRDGYTCTECGAEVGEEENPHVRTANIHHDNPRSEGGSDELENLTTLCKPCHNQKHSSSTASGRRALLTEREREIVSGDADDITDEYRYQTVSRIRSRLRRLEDDLKALDAHGELGGELRDIVYDGRSNE